MNHHNIGIQQSNLTQIEPILQAHLRAFAFPMDSFLEDRLTNSEIYAISSEDQLIGYASVFEGVLYFFHVLLAHFSLAPEILEKFILENVIDRVYVTTQDPLFAALIAEWDYEKKKDACFFTDGNRSVQPTAITNAMVFRLAQPEDLQTIAAATDPFFDSLEQRIQEQSIFLLEEGKQLLGCGLIEKGVFFPGCVSIGMITCKEYRRRGIGQSILCRLKEWAYENGYQPIAGCWYYNTLSRKTLEKAGMVAIGIGYEAKLTGKEKAPLITGRASGEEI